MMTILSMIMSGLALLAAACGLVLFVLNEKRSKKRNATLLQYIDRKAQQSAKDGAMAARKYVNEDLEKVYERIDKLEKGITPDYEQAKAAANAVNDFSKGITNILGFDPMEALKTERRKKEHGDME